jgi:hypothetical protein
MDADTGDDRYRTLELVWEGPPNRWTEQEVADLTPGTALDLACGEGRNTIWLPVHGWQVTAVHSSSVTLDKGSRRAHCCARRLH